MLEQGQQSLKLLTPDSWLLTPTTTEKLFQQTLL